ncbi:MAG: hypothetical protein FWB93_04315 [Oscillospiraceae bacterium]|nr:hypothetical protein [Oscillospiraceae bacterium]
MPRTFLVSETITAFIRRYNPMTLGFERLDDEPQVGTYDLIYWIDLHFDDGIIRSHTFFASYVGISLYGQQTKWYRIRGGFNLRNFIIHNFCELATTRGE